ncbi:integral membrane sensor signal transduction histidine kinase [Gracilibacillus halophilus YIM-C55.5]|uniref:histidine kinase n=1 Tax=Gracilibacillus halophilus YIM-C55.5 TaxID=1308866 RepID=N4WAB4_9BACI|nr:HAMP domain-containing sensor histidine kinase [Gracilibacillus halophilus]ENH97248.1 integral membrane sensor signal transduction histidine kinase [Gracilibacillus halophilus YIM-C55.5]
MLRNRENQYLIGVLLGITLCATILATLIFSVQVAFFVFLISILFIVMILIFTSWRYRKLKQLAEYLRQVSAGNYHLDIRENREGELSVLQNEIYKMTLKLTEQTTIQEKEKQKLGDAISDISHQLKTPLTSMIVMADLLYDQTLPEEKRIEFTKNIRDQLGRIEWLVSTLLKLSKIDAGTALFQQDKLYAKDLIDQAVESVLVPLDIKQQKVRIEGDDQTVLTCDFQWTTEAIVNILKNAVEHTPEGGDILIYFHENTLYTEIIIQDTGIGISKEDIPYIFKRFYKGKDAGNDSVGIGLAMAYSIVTNQQGDIQVSSQPGKGTQFRMKFFKQMI